MASDQKQDNYMLTNQNMPSTSGLPRHVPSLSLNTGLSTTMIAQPHSYNSLKQGFDKDFIKSYLDNRCKKVLPRSRRRMKPLSKTNVNSVHKKCESLPLKTTKSKVRSAKCFRQVNQFQQPTNQDHDVSDKKNEKVDHTNKSFCVICNVDCTSLSLLQDHKERDGHVCRVCAIDFKSHSELEIHFEKHSAYNCTECGLFFYHKKDILQHKVQCHSSERIECNICNKSFVKRSFKRHNWLHSNIEARHECVVCKKAYKFEKLLKEHTESVHVAFEFVECKVCHKLSLGTERLNLHMKNHLPEENILSKCPTCGKLLNSKSLKGHMEKHDDSVKLCEICGKSVTGANTMKLHVMKEHPNVGTFMCKFCNQQFNEDITLKRHVKKVHNKRSVGKPVFCEICGKELKNLTILKRHKLIHSDEKPFKCDICGAAFKHKVTLTTHSRVHSSIGKYCCDICCQTFKWKGTYDKHVKRCEMS